MPRKPKADDLKEFAVHLAKMKVRAGELGLYETMQALESPLKKAGWEIAAKKKAEATLRVDVERDPRHGDFRGFKLKRASDDFVVFWGALTPDPIRGWRELRKYLQQNPPGKFLISPGVKRFVASSRKIAWDASGANIVRKKK